MKHLRFLGIIFFSLLIVSSTNYGQSTMIAEINQEVITEFGTYRPYLVDIIPNIADYRVENNFANVINYSDFHFSDEQASKLRSNHFAVTEPGTTYNEIFDMYNKLREDGVPIFVTTDAMLHTFHLCFDYILMTVETKKFATDLRLLLEELIYQTNEQLMQSSEISVQVALNRNLNFLYIATHLLDKTFIPTSPDQSYYDELQLITAHSGFELSPLFMYEEDYSQYIPRGHYTRSDTLTHYFLSMMWLGRMTFAADPRYIELSETMSLSAILLIQAMMNSKIAEEDAINVWERIYNPTVFFVGKSDDINFYQYQNLCEYVYGESFADLPVDSCGDPSKLNDFLLTSFELEGPRITYPGQPKGFRFMGQRFTPDSWILDELVYDKVDDMRLMPTGLDIMTVLGSNTADQLLTDLGEKAMFPNYAVKLDSMKRVVDEYEDAIWAQNVYYNWLYSLMPLLTVKGEGYPYFMKSDAWRYKDLYAALASWAELRHDTILYVKQSGTERAIPDGSNLVQGYVEPNPYLYARLASLAEFMVDGLETNGLLFDDFRHSLLMLRDLLVSLKEISEKELTTVPLSPEDYELICNIGASLEQIVEFNQYGTEGPELDGMKMPVVADVHTDSNSGTCLEEGVGYPFEIFVICPVEGQLILTVGAGFSYYEFVHPISDRLTDEKWQDMLKSGEAPELAKWTSNFIADYKSETFTPTNYPWTKFGLNELTIELTAHDVEINTLVEITIQSDLTNADIQISIESTAGGIYSTTIQTDGNGFGTCSYTPTKSDTYYVTASHGTLSYRTSFRTFSATPVGSIDELIKPERFSMSQNYPNPFNANTMIQFTIPDEAHVNLVIYNLQGERVRTLVNRRLSAGNHTVHWDARDDGNALASSGVYIASIIAGDQRISQKMVLLF